MVRSCQQISTSMSPEQIFRRHALDFAVCPSLSAETTLGATGITRSVACSWGPRARRGAQAPRRRAS